MDQARLYRLPPVALTSVSVVGVEIGPVIVAFLEGRRKLPTQAEVHRELRSDAVIVLNVQRMDVLAQIGDEVVAEVDGARQAEDEIGEIVAGGVAGDGAAGSLAQ